jgi:hypothetical protein
MIQGTTGTAPNIRDWPSSFLKLELRCQYHDEDVSKERVHVPTTINMIWSMHESSHAHFLPLAFRHVSDNTYLMDFAVIRSLFA